MAVRITLNNIVPATVPADGWFVSYRILGSVGAYTTVGPFAVAPINIDTADPGGTLYEGYIIRDCGDLESAQYFWQTPCDCTNTGVGYAVSPGGDQCELNETAAPTVTNPGYCLATSQNSVYSEFGTRIYNPGFVDADLAIVFPGAGAGIYTTMTTAGQWANPTANISIGPMNREGVWIDSDCNGTKDPLGGGVQTTIAYLFNNLGATRTIHVGIAADNVFQVVVNGSIVATYGAGGDQQFKVWHIIPITVVPGANYINAIATGDGSVNDAVAMVVYDNTAAQIAAAASDLDLTIAFQSSSLRGTTYDVATCPATYSMDTSGGSGNYICRKTTYGICNAATP